MFASAKSTLKHLWPSRDSFMTAPRNGFSLIELMVVVAVIAVLAGVAYPSYRNQIMKSNRVEARNALLQVQVAQEKFFLQFGRYAGDSGGSTTELVNAPTHATTPGLGIPASTASGYYTISLVRPTTTTYTATATATGGQANDNDCRTLSITETGNKTSTKAGGGASSSCWK